MHIHRASLLSCLALFAGLACWAPSPQSQAASSLVTTQLPRNVRPLKYDVELEPDAAALKFAGRASVLIEITKPTSSITLNAADLAFSKVSLAGDSLDTPLVAEVSVDARNQTATMRFTRTLKPGEYRLMIEYSGKIGTQSAGLFALDYPTADGQKRALFTQFENSDARRMIPCWDEPEFKAVFSLQAVLPGSDMPVSNMPVAERQSLADGRVRVRFGATPRMSTYLLFFATGDFERITDHEGPTEVGVVTRRGATEQGRFALTGSKEVLREYNQYFGVPYPLPKLDNVAAPGASEFFGAMENWGAIFTFEYALLLDPNLATQSDVESVFAIGAHEIAHQWFGNLVTMHWWDDIWLNEGFASWMEGRTTAKLHPEWNTALAAVGVREGAMAQDSLKATHPVVQHIHDVEQASQAFDSITYLKGESVIRMLEGYVGEDGWRQGVQRYIKAHAYGNTASDDLWHAIEEATGKPITKIAHEFTLQPGIPLIRVESARCVGDHTAVTLTQGEFTRDRPNKKPLSWSVPVIARVGAGAESRVVVTGGKADLTVPGCGSLRVNAGQTGYYRTWYAPSQMEDLRRTFGTITPIDQLGLLADRWALGFAGVAPVTDYLDLVAATPTTAAAPVWSGIANNLRMLDQYYAQEPARRAVFRRFAIARLAPVFASVGWTARSGEATSVAKLRNALIATLSELGDSGVIEEAGRRYAAQATDPSAVPGPLRKIIIGVVAAHADGRTWDSMRTVAQNEKNPLMRDYLYSALAMAEDEALAKRALDLSLTSEPGETTGAGMIRTVAFRHPDLAFDFAYANIDAVLAKVDSSSRTRFFSGLTGQSSSPAMITKLNEYAQKYLAPGSRREAEAAATAIGVRIGIRKERLPLIDQWLESRVRT